MGGCEAGGGEEVSGLELWGGEGMGCRVLALHWREVRLHCVDGDA